MKENNAIENIKKQLYKQIEKLPEKEQSEMREKIESMSEDDFEKLIKNQTQSNNCIFCSIIKKEIPSIQINENEDAIAILEINPQSKAHTLIVSKIHESNTTKEMIELSKTVSSKIINAYSPLDINVNEGKMFGHNVLEIIPNYGEKLEKKKVTTESLEEIKKELQKSEKLPEKKKEESVKIEENEKKENKSEENTKQKLPHFEERIP